MDCIICNKCANALGSHIIPASLIKNCVGNHYKEESYEIDSNKLSINVFFGRDNLKNTSTDVKRNHYKRDNVLCKMCEEKLGCLEGEISANFLQKFREQKYSSNFEELNIENGIEILIPLKTYNNTFLAYFYSIILRECRVMDIEDEIQVLTKQETENIKQFVYGYLYDINNDDAIRGYKMVIIFDKKCNKGSYIATLNGFKKPYLFYYCEAIIQLFTNKPDELSCFLFAEAFNDIKFSQARVIVGPQEFYATLRTKMAAYLADIFLTKGIMKICSLNGKSYKENLKEYLDFSKETEDKIVSLKKIIEKYGG